LGVYAHSSASASFAITKYLAGPEPVAVNRHGKVIGFYIPLRRDEVRHAVAQLGKAVEQVIDETGLGEDELAGLFDTRRPSLNDRRRRRPTTWPAGTDAGKVQRLASVAVSVRRLT